MAPRGLAGLLTRHEIDEMLFTPSFYKTVLTVLARETAAALPRRRVKMNGDILSDDPIAVSLHKVLGAEVWKPLEQLRDP